MNIKKICWVLQSGGKVLEKAIKYVQCAYDESLASLFRAAYFIESNLSLILNFFLCVHCLLV